jgi:hypothetical protein
MGYVAANAVLWMVYLPLRLLPVAVITPPILRPIKHKGTDTVGAFDPPRFTPNRTYGVSIDDAVKMAAK